MDKKEKMTASLEKNLPTVKSNRPIKIDKDIKDDYEFSRKTYKDLIYNGTRSMVATFGMQKIIECQLSLKL